MNLSERCFEEKKRFRDRHERQWIARRINGRGERAE